MQKMIYLALGSFLQTVKSNETAKIPNDIFAGKANNTDELDVIKLALQK